MRSSDLKDFFYSIYIYSYIVRGLLLFEEEEEEVRWSILLYSRSLIIITPYIIFEISL